MKISSLKILTMAVLLPHVGYCDMWRSIRKWCLHGKEFGIGSPLQSMGNSLVDCSMFVHLQIISVSLVYCVTCAKLEGKLLSLCLLCDSLTLPTKLSTWHDLVEKMKLFSLFTHYVIKNIEFHLLASRDYCRGWGGVWGGGGRRLMS